jgi:hypothetical protein
MQEDDQMRVTIVADDDTVLVDGKPQAVDCKQLVTEGKHAVQWYGAFGEVEFRSELNAEKREVTRKANEKITDIAPYQSYIDAWNVENAKQGAAKKQADAKALKG